MFDSYEVEQDYFEVTPWQAGTFEQNPCLDPWDATFINTALASTDPALQLRVLEQCERFKSFYSSIQARAAARLDTLTGTTPEHHPLSIERGTAHAIALARHQTPKAPWSTCAASATSSRHALPLLRFEHGHLGEDMILAIMTPLDDSTTAERTEFDRFYQQHPTSSTAPAPPKPKTPPKKPSTSCAKPTHRRTRTRHRRTLPTHPQRQGLHPHQRQSLPEIGLALDDFLTREVNKASPPETPLPQPTARRSIHPRHHRPPAR
ncbi:hypothetical protein SLW72_14125 [Glutamicibacter protophormiae]|uniref:hypothetical protein n=1 Tax=Glutamicibacter protophormiae TaxID=37930 RepID=UPI002A802A0F|nr:hypothetical protein [Glutamicibacter protophormiae]WPR64008.1 hypothetical protein SLW72_14125 [Glutamicibacter protophormiae]